MIRCPACLENTNDFLHLDSGRLKKYLAYSQDYYDGMFHKYLDILKPELNKCKYGHVFYKNMPSDDILSEMYSFEKEYLNNPARPPSQDMVQTMKKCFSIIGKKNPCILDYGAGHGRWSNAASIAGFKVVAYEPHASRTVEDNNYELALSEEDIPPYKFDLIWLEQVMEHVKDPYVLLQDVKKYTHKDTILRLSVPNINRAKEGNEIWHQWPYNGKSNHTLAPYQHLQGFTQKSLSKLVHRSGFQQLNSLSLHFNEPVYKIRLTLGKVFRRGLSTTTFYLKPSSANNIDS